MWICVSFCLFVSILKVTFLHFFARFLCLLAGCCLCEKQIYNRQAATTSHLNSQSISEGP